MMVVSSALSSDHGFLPTAAAPGGQDGRMEEQPGFSFPNWVFDGFHPRLPLIIENSVQGSGQGD